jgi:hypothetical protein
MVSKTVRKKEGGEEMGALSMEAADGTEVFYSAIHSALQEYMDDRDIENMGKETQNKWNAALIYIYKSVFKITDETVKYNNKNSNIDYSDDKLLNDICDIYVELCYEYDKEISIMGFSKLTGIHPDTIYSWANSEYRAGTSHSDIYKKLNTEREESLSDMLISGKRNPVGLLGALNRHYGWNMGQPRENVHKIQSQGAEQIAAKYGIELVDTQKNTPPVNGVLDDINVT